MQLTLTKWLLGGALCGFLSASAQVVLPAANGSTAPLTPLTLTKKSLRKLAQSKDLRTDFVKSRNQYFIVAYEAVPSADLQAQVASVATYVSYIPSFTYLYTAKDAVAAAAQIEKWAAGRVGIKGVGAMPWEFKLSDQLYAEYRQQGQLTADTQNAGVVVSVFSADDLPALRQTLERWEVEALDVQGRSLRVSSADMDLVKQFALIPYVSRVEAYVAPQNEDDPDIRYIMKTNAIDAVNYDRKGPIGNGVTFMNWEKYGGGGHFEINSYGRTLPGRLGDNRLDGHGTTVGTIVAGANNLGEWKTGGMAPGTTYLSNLTYGIFAEGAQNALNAGYTPLVTNYSVGFGKGNVGYSDAAKAIDQVVYNSNAYLHFFSAGNNSDGTFLGYPKEGYATITGDHKTSKNSFVVHSTGMPGVDVSFAAFGPTKDGRLKPDISAQGSGGTSYASPGAAGLASVLMQQYRDTYGQPARADVVKAAMLNTALRVRVFYPKGEPMVDTINHITYRAGFGQINPLGAVETIKEQRVYIGSPLRQGAQNEHVVNIPEGQTEARFMLYYNDVPGTAGAAKILVNDLDLVVIDPDGNEILPWTLDPAPDRVHLPPTRTVNRRDNVEQVVITAPTKEQTLKAGAYRLRVVGHEIPEVALSPQYVLTWQSRPRGIRLTSLPEGYRVATGDALLLTWELTLPLNENKLVGNRRNLGIVPTVAYRKQESDAWTAVNAMTDRNGVGEYGAYYFHLTATDAMKSGALQFRVQMGDDMEAISNKIQVAQRVITRPNIIDFSSKHVTLSWTAPNLVSTGKYYIHALYDKYMTIIDSVDMPTTRRRVAAPAGVTFNENTWFAISHKSATTKAMSQRTLPNALTQRNRYATPATYWPNLVHALCGEDEITLHTIKVPCDIQWYRFNGEEAVAIPAEQGGKANSRTFTVADAGRYYYIATTTGSPQEVLYHSDTLTINAPQLDPADAKRYGENLWLGSVYYDKTADVRRQITDKSDLPLYGLFSFAGLSLDSHEHLFSWKEDNMMKIPGYRGCDTPGKSTNHLISMKRGGFKPGTYTFAIDRAAHRARLIFRDREGNIIKEVHSRQNSANETPFTVDLDENSTCEIQWLGEHFKLTVTPPAYTPPTFEGFEEGALYRIKSAFPGYQQQQGVEKSIYMNYERMAPRWKTHEMTYVGELFQLKARPQGWPYVSIKEMNTGRYLTYPGNSATTFATIYAESLGQHQFKLKNGNAVYHTNLHGNGTGGEGNLVAYNAGLNSASAWYLEKAKAVQLRVSQVGYATAYYPFSVKVPALGGFEVFKPVSLDNDGHAMVLSKIPAGTVVHAKTPLIIRALPGYYSFEIAYEQLETEAPQDTRFRGVTYPSEIPATAYVMHYDATKGIGFYPVRTSGNVSATKLGANRVYYLPDTSRPAPSMLVFQYGDTTTGMQTPSVGKAMETSYEVSGKVAPPQSKGILITPQGKKIYKAE